MMDILNFAKTKPSAKIPTKREGDAGRDIYACFEEDELVIMPFESALIPTGIATAFPKEYQMILKERGSTGTRNLKTNAGVIDSNFRGEIFVSLYNGNHRPLKITKNPEDKEGHYFIIYPYDKAICQAVMSYCPEFQEKEISYEDLLKIPSERGTDMLGSTNNKGNK